MRHVISVLMQNEVGALTRLTGLFSTRGYNIESLNVAPTEDPAISRLTLVTTGSDAALSQIAKQVSKLVDVVDMHDMTLGDHFERELALLKLVAGNARALAEWCDQFVAAIGRQADIIALVRSGSLGISRGERVFAGQVRPLPIEGQAGM